LYFIGTILVGNKKSFWAVFVLIILPYPAEFGSDALREWPHILFLASGILFLFLAIKHSKPWMFGAAGFFAGLGHTIRPECAQILIYGILWICIRLFTPKPGMSRPRLLCASLVLLIGFAIPAAPYMTARGRVLPAKLKILISSAGPEELKSRKGRLAPEILELEIDSDDIIYPVRYAKTLSHGVNTVPQGTACATSGMPRKISKAFCELAGAMSENLMYYFLPVLLIGIYFRFRKNSSATKEERLIMLAFAALNVVMLITLHYFWEFISRRHCLPLVALTIFYVPIGLQVSADWLANRFSPASPIRDASRQDGLRHKSRPASDQDRRRWFFILLIIGTAICLPKLLSRLGSDKPGYRTAAEWLKENTAPDDLIAVPDRRITFYAERKALLYETDSPGKTDYVVLIVKDENQVPGFDGDAQKKFSVWQNERRKNKIIVVYKMP
jgi:hypothetical protein